MKNLLLLLTTLLTWPVFAQKVDLDAEPVSVRFTRMPKQPFPPAYATYSAVLSANPGDLGSVGMNEKFFTDYLKVPGFQKIKEGGNFNLDLTLSDYKSDKTEMKIDTKQEKDSKGNVTETKTYHTEVTYVHSLSILVRSEDGKTIGRHSWLESPRIFKSRGYGNSSDLAAYNRVSLGRDLA
ncbi:MAG: hypothetical protein ABIO24_08780, partial [Saprospiraceae bacterium]